MPLAFFALHGGLSTGMASSNLRTLPKPGELWLSRPPFLMVARVVGVDAVAEPALVSYEIHDRDGAVLESVREAPLDGAWWRTFQPLERRFG